MEILLNPNKNKKNAISVIREFLSSPQFATITCNSNDINIKQFKKFVGFDLTADPSRIIPEMNKKRKQKERQKKIDEENKKLERSISW